MMKFMISRSLQYISATDLQKFLLWLHILLTTFTTYLIDILTQFEIFTKILYWKSLFFFSDHFIKIKTFLKDCWQSSRFCFHDQLWNFPFLSATIQSYFKRSFDEVHIFSRDQLMKFSIFSETICWFHNIFQGQIVKIAVWFCDLLTNFAIFSLDCSPKFILSCYHSSKFTFLTTC